MGIKSEILAEPFNFAVPWMPYIAISGSDQIPIANIMLDELHRKLGVVTVIRNTYFVRVTFGQDEPNTDGLTIKSVGIFSAAVGGTLGEYWILDSFSSKDNIDEIVVECAITILHEPSS